jgi:tetratricopeptide (TPR) repeat protein
MERFQAAPLLRILQAALLAVLVLSSAALVLKPIEQNAWRALQAGQAELRMDALDKSVGSGVVLGIMGGLRSLVADFAWLELNRKWEGRDRAGLEAMVQLVTSIDPRPEFFWINSARMIGYDVPHWRIAEEGGYILLPKAEQDRIIAEQADEALALLQRGLRVHPHSPRLKLEVGQIYLNRRRDFESAAPWFLAASKEKNAPYFAARIYADLLLHLDRTAEAYAFLKTLYLELPDDPMAQADIVLERIRQLEVQLGIDGTATFSPDP